MAIFQPSNIIPSSQAGPGNGVIDVNNALTVSWQVNGPSALSAYRILIMQNDTASTKLYDTSEVYLVDPFYGTDSQGNKQMFSATSIPSATLISSGLVNGYENGYKITIGQFWENGTNNITKRYVSSGITYVAVGTVAFIAAVGSKGIYRFVYRSGSWYLGANVVTLNNYGIVITGSPSNGDEIEVLYGYSSVWQTAAAFFETRNTPTIVIDPFMSLDHSWDSSTITNVTLNSSTFLSQVNNAPGKYVFEFFGTWQLNGGFVNLGTYGLSYTGSATFGDTITVIYGIDTREVTLTATYTQAQGDALDMVEWQIEDASGDILLDQKTYGTNELKVTYNGLFTGEKYTVTVTVQTENGITISDLVDFYVHYATDSLSGSLAACAVCDKSAVSVEWPYVNTIIPSVSGTYSISGGVLTVDANSTITYNQVNNAAMRFSAPWTVVAKGQIEQQGYSPAPFLRINTTAGVIYFEFSSSMLDIYYIPVGMQVHRRLLYETIAGWTEDDIFTFVLTGSTINVRWDHVITGATLFPSSTLYPSATLYPGGSGGTTIVTTQFADSFTYDLGDITGIVLGNNFAYPLKYDYLWVLGETIDPSTLNDVLQDPSFEPSYTSSTDMLAPFTYDLSGGNIGALPDAVIGFAVYRREGMSGGLLHLADVGVDVSKIYDYGAKSQTQYTYYMFPKGQNTYITQAISSNSVTPIFWNWSVILAEKDADGTYQVQAEYVFANNIVSGAIGNNNSPNLQQNFTRYPLRQAVSACYRSGSLQAYIGKVGYQNGKYNYYDSVDLAEQLYELSISPLTKFLKDRKGNLWMIDTSAPISMTAGDNMAQQPYTISLPWVEVGDAKDVALIGQ